jgi:2-polyprenyl-3-methyl-5-hydroxy-6-metoxy-1,4-benzoquinol methylase
VDEHLATNLRFWDEIAPHHAASQAYAVDSFVAGRNTLGAPELAEVGDVTGRELVHLQCHIGLDSLSWARLGAHVTGVDFSAEAVRIARRIADRAGLQARFVEAEVTEAPTALGRTFDVVFTSRGVLMWLADLDRWAQACATLLEPGGRFYLLDHHPLSMALTTTEGGLVLARSYFPTSRPGVSRYDGSYAVRDVGLVNDETHEWIHPVGEVVTSLVRAGITIDSVTEWPADQLSPAEAGGNPADTLQLPAFFSVVGHRS